jgi:FAD synthetase
VLPLSQEGKSVNDERVRKYIGLAEERLKEGLKARGPKRILDRAKDYLDDGKHYFERGDNATALASVSYSHGLLDGVLLNIQNDPDRELRTKGLIARIFTTQLFGPCQFEALLSSLPGDRECLERTFDRLISEKAVERNGNEVTLTPEGRKRILVGVVAGVFDLIHPGHLAFLNWAKQRTDVLVAVVARDPSSEKRKGRRPVQAESDRLKLVSQLKAVDAAILGDKKDIYAPIMRVKPDLILLGKDQEADAKQIRTDLRRRGLEVRILRSRAWDSGEISKTRKIISKIEKDLLG